MSFARFALRRAAVKAVRAGTYAKVFDSEMAPIDQFASGQRVPVVMVYTDEAAASIDGNQLFSEATQKLVFEVAITQKMKIPATDPETGEVVGEEAWMTPPTDSFMELTLDLLCRDVIKALQHPENAWADLFRDMCVGVPKMSTMRGIAGEKEDRFAGRQIVFDVEMLREPVPSDVAEGSVWQRFLALVSEDDDGVHFVSLLEASLAQNDGDDLASHELLMQSYGLSAGESTDLTLDDFGDWPDGS